MDIDTDELDIDSSKMFNISEKFKRLLVGVETYQENSHEKLDKFKQRCSKIYRIRIRDSIDLKKLFYLKLSPFRNLIELYLDLCPPSVIEDLFDLRKQIEILEITNSGIPELLKTFAPHLDDVNKDNNEMIQTLTPMILTLQNSDFAIRDKFNWKKLKRLTLCNCGIARLDKSIHFFPELEFFDLSYNDITHIIHLQDCFRLFELNLSFNRIQILSNISLVLGNIVRLSLSNNRIQSLDGLDKLYALETLDLSNNFIDDFNEINYINKLPCLEHVFLYSNPIQKNNNHYRYLIYHQFLHGNSYSSSTRAIPILDNIPMTTDEKKAFRYACFM
jgi:hypothetical protein